MFFSDNRGTIAISSAVGGLMLVGVVGASYDVSTLVSDHNTLQAVADAAALAAAQPQKASVSERKRIANATVDDYLRQTGSDLDVDRRKVTVEASADRVSVQLGTMTDLVFGDMIGKGTVGVAAQAVAQGRSERPPIYNNAGVSISFVLDLSDSMDTKTDGKRRLDRVKSSIKDALTSAWDQDVDAGLYPFSWGPAETFQVPLQDGTGGVIAKLNLLTTSEGSVPSSSMESAVDALSGAGAAQKKVLVYITDGGVDYTRGDRPGHYLGNADILSPDNGKACGKAEKKRDHRIGKSLQKLEELLEAAKDKDATIRGITPRVAMEIDGAVLVPGVGITLAPAGATTVNLDDSTRPVQQITEDSVLPGIDGDGLLGGALGSLGPGGPGVGSAVADSGTLSMEIAETLTALSTYIEYDDDSPELTVFELDDGDVETETLKGEGVNSFLSAGRKVLLAESNYIEACQPVQIQRVIEACERARNENIDIHTVNLSGETGSASVVSNACALGDAGMWSPIKDSEIDKSNEGVLETTADGEPVPLPDTEKGRDGSVYVVSEDASELRDLLLNILPERTPTKTTKRVVRLVR